MAIARTGVFVDDYVEYSSTLPGELQRLLNTTRELDERSQAMINHTRQQTKYSLGLTSQVNSMWRKNKEVEEEDDDEMFEKLRKEIEAYQDNALSLCTEKVLLARQAHDLIDSHIKRLDEDLNNFMEDLKQEGKIAPDESAVLPPLPLVPKNEKSRSLYGTPQSKRIITGKRIGTGSAIEIWSSCRLLAALGKNLLLRLSLINPLIQMNLLTVFVIRFLLVI